MDSSQGSPSTYPSSLWPHLSFDFISQSKDLNDHEAIRIILHTAVKVAGMRTLFGPIVTRTDTELPGGGYATGLTGFVALHESHASLHTFVEQRVVMFDLFSCLAFDYNEVADYLAKALYAEGKYEVKLLWRRFPPTRHS